MTNGEMIQSMFPNMNFGTLAQDDVIVNKDYSNNDEPQVFIPQRVWNAEYKEPFKYKGESKESATVAKFHDFYPEDSETWPPADKELLVKNHVGDNFIAYLGYDNSEDGGWGFYSEDGDFIADLDEIDAWMPIPQHERDKNYIPVQERKAKAPIFSIDDLGPEEEKDR